MIAAIDTEQPLSVFIGLYDRYAPAFYGDIKRNLYQDDVCNQALFDAFQQIWEKMAELSPGQQPSFTWCYQIVRKQIGKKKVELMLKEIFACQMIPNVAA